MDEIDFKILTILFDNCRMTYRELSEKIGLTVGTIFKRIKTLEDDGVLTAYIARPSLLALNCLAVLIFGTSNARSMDAVSKELGQNENIISVAVTGGKFLYISAFVKNISELQDYTNFVSTTAQISEPTIGLVNVPYTTFPEPLTGIDYKILKSLNKDARKPMTDMADEVGASTKTIRKRLDRMIENYLVTFTIEWNPLHQDSFLTGFHIDLNDGTNINTTMENLNNKYAKNIIVCISYSNIPNKIFFEIWSKTARESHLVQEELQNEGFKDVTPHIFYSIEWYECWIDQLLRTK